MTFFIALLLIIGIVIIFDISEKINHFVENKAPSSRHRLRLLCELRPVFCEYVQPAVRVHHGHILHLQNGGQQRDHRHSVLGVSYKRMMVPYMVSALLIATLSLSQPLGDSEGERQANKFRTKIYKTQELIVLQ